MKYRNITCSDSLPLCHEHYDKLFATRGELSSSTTVAGSSVKNPATVIDSRDALRSVIGAPPPPTLRSIFLTRTSAMPAVSVAVFTIGGAPGAPFRCAIPENVTPGAGRVSLETESRSLTIPDKQVPVAWHGIIYQRYCTLWHGSLRGASLPGYSISATMQGAKKPAYGRQ